MRQWTWVDGVWREQQKASVAAAVAGWTHWRCAGGGGPAAVGAAAAAETVTGEKEEERKVMQSLYWLATCIVQ